eukprot:3095078-Rhodomonas_salina.2
MPRERARARADQDEASQMEQRQGRGWDLDFVEEHFFAGAVAALGGGCLFELAAQVEVGGSEVADGGVQLSHPLVVLLLFLIPRPPPSDSSHA